MTEGAWNPDKVRVQIARDLREIVRLWRLLPDEAEAQAAGRDPAGLDALNLAGPAANLEAWTYKLGTARRLGRDDLYANDQTAALHPLLLLASWEDVVRDERNQPTDLKATVERAADYLGKSIDWMLDTNEYGDMNFLPIDDLAEELRSCRRALEDVLLDGIRAEVSRVWCVADANHDEGDRVRLHYRAGASVDLDRWVCPKCDARYDYGEFIRARRVNLDAEGADRFVLIADAKEAASVPEQTIRSWIRRDVVQTQRDPKTNRLMVWWPDVRDATRDRERRRQLGHAGVGA